MEPEAMPGFEGTYQPAQFGLTTSVEKGPQKKKPKALNSYSNV